MNDFTSDVADLVAAYVAIYESGDRNPATSQIVAVIFDQWGESFTDERYMAAEEAMYRSPEVQAIYLLERARRSEPPVLRSPLPITTRAAVWDKTGGVCTYCGVQTNPFRDFSVDHVIPVSKGGSDDLDNLVPCCRSCNSRKGARQA